MSYKPDKWSRKKGDIRRRDLADLVTQPIAMQLDEIREELVRKIQGVEESIEVLARQKLRELRSESDGGTEESDLGDGIDRGTEDALM